MRVKLNSTEKLNEVLVKGPKELPAKEERYCNVCGQPFITALQVPTCNTCFNKRYYRKI